MGSRPGNPHSLGGGSSVTECDTYRQFWQVRLKAPTERNIVASARRVAEWLRQNLGGRGLPKFLRYIICLKVMILCTISTFSICFTIFAS